MKIKEKFHSLLGFVKDVDGTKALELLLSKIDWGSIELSEEEIIGIVDIKNLAKLTEESWIEKYPSALKKRIKKYASDIAYSKYHISEKEAKEIFEKAPPKVLEFFEKNYFEFKRQYDEVIMTHHPPGAG